MNIVSSTNQIAQPSESEEPSYGTISLLGWAHFLNDGAANYLPGILPAILVSLGLSVSMAGTLMGALLAGQALQPLTGLLSDKIGGRAFTVLGLACTSLAAALIAFAQTFATLVIVLLLLGVANAAFHPQTLASVRLASGKRVGTGLSVFLIGGEIGRGIWPLLASLLVTARGVGSLWVLGLPALLTLPILWRRAPSVPPRTKDAARVRWSEHMRPLALLVVFSSLRGVLLYAVSAFVPILWHVHGGSLAGGAGFITVLMLVGLIGNLAGGRLGDSMDPRVVICAGMGIALAAMVGFLLADGLWRWLLISFVGIGLFATFPLTILIGQDIVPENRSFGSGMALGLSNALGALGVVALGPVAGAWGTEAALWGGLIAGVLSLPFIAFLHHRE